MATDTADLVVRLTAIVEREVTRLEAAATGPSGLSDEDADRLARTTRMLASINDQRRKDLAALGARAAGLPTEEAVATLCQSEDFRAIVIKHIMPYLQE